jgi:hypothetical protein
LMHLPFFAETLHDLQIGIVAAAFDAEIHRPVRFLYV